MTKKELTNKYFFILNGPDLEMDEIIKILDKERIDWVMPYQDRSEKTIKFKDLKEYKNDKRIRVYVECFPEKRIERSNDIYIDHHCKFIRRRAALIQVKKIFKLKITKKDLWIEGYDRGGVFGAFKAGMNKRLIKKWIEDSLKRFGSHKGYNYWLNLIKKSPTIQNLKIVTIQAEQKMAHTSSILQIYDLMVYPRRKNLLTIVTQKNKIIKFLFTADPKISRQLYKKLGGFLFGNPALKNVSWGIDQKWPIPKKEEVLEVVTKS